MQQLKYSLSPLSIDASYVKQHPLSNLATNAPNVIQNTKTQTFLIVIINQRFLCRATCNNPHSLSPLSTNASQDTNTSRHHTYSWSSRRRSSPGRTRNDPGRTTRGCCSRWDTPIAAPEPRLDRAPPGEIEGMG